MKTCSKCLQIKPFCDFSLKNKARAVYMSYCKECNREYQKWHYRENKSDYYKNHNLYRKQVREINREHLLNFLHNHPCVDCGETDPVVLEFDHVLGEKHANIGTLMNNAASWRVIKAEIGKCEVRCANCHKRRTAKQFGWYKNIHGAIV